MSGYVHGYTEKEGKRLKNQANILQNLLHGDVRYNPGVKILEAGCGVGAQTISLAANNPDAQITAMDINSESVDAARHAASESGLTNVEFRQGDILATPFPDATFDHVFICFVLEHLPNPQEVLLALKRLIKPGGTITVIEGDHGSAYFHPDSDAAKRAIQCQIELQSRAGGDACIGRKLFPLLKNAGFDSPQVTLLPVYTDASRPEWVNGFTKNTFTAMIEGVADKAISAGLTNAEDFACGISDLYRTAEENGSFCYTFFKCVAKAS